MALLSVALASFTGVVFALALALAMPAAALESLVALPVQVEGLSGTVLDGRARLSGGYALIWQARPAQLLAGRAALAVHLAGPDTLLDAIAGRGPVDWSVDAITGRAGPGLLALAPGLPVSTCTMSATVDVRRLVWGKDRAGAEGTVTTPAGTCTDFSGRDLPVPPLHLALASEGRDAVGTLTSADGTALGRIAVTGDRRLMLRVEPAGAALVPGMPTSAATELEYPF